MLLLDQSAQERFPYGARSAAAVYVGDLLRTEVPAIADGRLDIVALARRPGVLSKVAIRARADGSTPLKPGIGADHVARVRAQLDGERIHVVAWQRSAPAYIAEALGLGEVPPSVLMPGLGHARVLLGDIDRRGIAGWRGLNVLVASALTGWRIRLEAISATAAWQRLRADMAARRALTATIVGHSERGARVEVYGLYAICPNAPLAAPGSEVQVWLTRLDPDEGRIRVSARDDLTAGGGFRRRALLL